MGVKLDWDIESEQGKHQEHKEDMNERLTRYSGVFKLLGVIAVFVAIVGIGVFLVYQRLEQVESRLEGLLVDTVKSEVASLRIGDFDTFMSIQRSPDDTWMMSQEQLFENYQQLKVTRDVTLSGRVLDVAVDGQRGRVRVEEIIDGVPYQRVWFYWRWQDDLDDNGEVVSEGGWRHGAPDYTFWGETETLENDRFTVTYQSVDASIAEAMQTTVARWLSTACEIFDCASVPPITMIIEPNRQPEPSWTDVSMNEWRMVVPSPFTGRARIDVPFNYDLQTQVATQLAEQFVDHAMTVPEVTYPADAYYVRSAVVAWLVGQFMQVNTDADLVTSLAQNYGTDTVVQLVQSLQPRSNIAILSAVTGVPTLAELNVSWRDFIVYRLNTEADLIQRRDEANWRQLYDGRDQTVLNSAYNRYNDINVPQSYTVLGMELAAAPDGTPQLRAEVQLTGSDGSVSQTTIAFNLVDNVWLRAN